ncbi:hypothetical protein BCR37DRAFT_380600 [Protomyces lactucae-debilis]|uniref:Uncharacterized protein n=1 Tax=Protomyces lactucae-debilis TaxID=2754530 RepID=A0A1Y2FB20_PROLT|nr:uncharacterized protein BCR37DRAFT_380600 [Protomyces lactucae-debilis]ORY80827.1 hypothetical protein BCR37DRAFT_380600 [Protomyces lactucae-debilis]
MVLCVVLHPCSLIITCSCCSLTIFGRDVDVKLYRKSSVSKTTAVHLQNKPALL